MTIDPSLGSSLTFGVANDSEFFDAPAPSIDPTATLELRRALHAALVVRLRQLRGRLRTAIIETDVLGLGPNLAMHGLHPYAARLASFNALVESFLAQAFKGDWLDAKMARAWVQGREMAQGELGMPIQTFLPEDELTGARTELSSLETALRVQVARAAGGAINSHLSQPRAWLNVAAAFDTATGNRAVVFANTQVVQTHLRSKIAAYREAGIGRVGVTAERLALGPAKSRSLTRLQRSGRDSTTVPARDATAEEIAERRAHYGATGPDEPEPDPGWEALRAEGDEDESLVGVRTAEDDAVCDICQDIADDTYTLDEALDVLPAHPNCLPGDSLILPVGRITAVSERFYNGDLIIIRTASGRKLSCTPNHSVFTDHGEVAARALNIGSKVVSYPFSEAAISSINTDDQYMPSRIEDIAASFAKSWPPSAVPLTAPDFHGDALDGDIAIIWTDSFLRSPGQATILQQLQKTVLGWRIMQAQSFSGLSALYFCFKGVMLSTARFLGGGILPLALADSHSRPFDDFLFGLSSHGDVPLQKFGDDRSRKTVSLSERLYRLTGQIFSDDCFLDEVVDLDTCCHVGPVYNLETEAGYYIAQGIATHNCRCSVVPLWDARFSGDAEGGTGAGGGGATNGTGSNGGMQSALGFSLPGGPGIQRKRKFKVIRRLYPEDEMDAHYLADAEPQTLYVRRPLKDADDLIAWAHRVGFIKTLAPDDMHVTIAFSKIPVDWSKIEAVDNTITLGSSGDYRSVESLGDKGAVVLCFDSPNLQERWRELCDAGAVWDYPTYRPHVTITYDGGAVDISTVEPFLGPLEFGPEVFEEIKGEWFEKIKLVGDKIQTDAFNPDQPRDPQGRWGVVGGSVAQIDTPQFKAWFGNSKVVDAGGKPLVLYHGTDRSLHEFSKEKIGDRFPLSFGFHFTSRTQEAGIYAEGLDPKFSGVAEGANILPVYLKAENPLVVETKNMTASMEADLNRAQLIHEIVASRKTDHPYDSIIIKRTRGDEYDGINVIVFNPEQIKSAIGNRGTFDPRSPRIVDYNPNEPV